MLVDIKAEQVGVTATVSAINPGPSEQTSGGSGIANLPLPEYGSVVIAPPTNLPMQMITRPDGSKVKGVVFKTQFPSFFGETNIPGAYVFFEIHSSQVIRGSTISDSSGNFRWISPEPVTPGYHELTVHMRHPVFDHLRGTQVLPFVIDLPANTALQPLTPPLKTPSGGYVASAIDIVLQIPNEHRQIKPGEKVLAKLELFETIPNQNSEEVTVRYVIKDSRSEVLSTSEETLTFKNRLSIIKTFHTATNLPGGEFTVSATIPSTSFISASSDIFKVTQDVLRPIVAQTTYDPTTVNMFILLSIFFTAIIYFEYRRFMFAHNQIKNFTKAGSAPFAV